MEKINSIVEYFRFYLSNFTWSSFTKPTIGLNSIIDILVVAFFTYQVLTWVKETRAWALFKGIFVIIIVSFIAELFELHTVSWLISNTFSVGITAAIVLFQPELRKALEQLGKGKLTQIFSSGESSITNFNPHTIEEIITACKKMSNVRTGALIVLENKVALGDLEATGISIDALVTSQLLINIFENKTPLHDGAVIIRNDRISSATAILPLTQAEVSSELGTRHRAAIGTSETSDAYIVVVSEETGAISIAHNGKIHRDLTDSEMRTMLIAKTQPSKKKLTLRKGRV